MRVPIEWLREYVDAGLKSESLADRLTMAGSEVSAIEFHGRGIEGVVVGKIKTIEPHPKTDDLLVLRIDIGTKLLQIVTNVKTLKVGDKVPVAVHGAKLAKEIHVEKRELHGVESFGMLCSLEHLGLAEESSEVMKLDKDAPFGENIRNVLGVKGAILEVDVLPNRGDLLSIFGVAREVAAVLDKKLNPIKCNVVEKGENIKVKAKVEVKDSELCPRYMARVVEGVKVDESPAWMKDRLISCGLRPINNIVDVTNYILLEMGQPLHAFDLSLLEGSKIVVRKAAKGETILTLDGEKRQLPANTLVIADAKKPVAVAGVMGGGNSEVRDETTSILLESAYFKPTSVNKTSRSLKLRTDSSVRFERGVDWQGVARALDRAAGLIAEVAGGKISKGVIDVYKKKVQPEKVQLRLKYLNNILGTKISRKDAAAVLKRLGFGVARTKSASVLNVSVPTFRAGDIEREIDLVEEIARIHGYDKIGSDIPRITYSSRKEDRAENLVDSIKDSLKGQGFFEAQTFSIVSPKSLGAEEGLMITNPLSEEISCMRTMLVPGLIGVISRNVSRQVKDIAVFEIGKVFAKSSKVLPAEKLSLALAITGEHFSSNFRLSVKEDINYYIVKAALETLFGNLGISGYQFNPMDVPILQAGKSSAILIKGEEVGLIGELSAELKTRFDLPHSVCVSEVSLDRILSLSSLDKRYKPLGKYPKVSRDIAMFVPQGVCHADIQKVIRDVGGSIIERVDLFDYYKGKQVPEGHVGLAYGIDYRDPAKTLTDQEVNMRHEVILAALKEKFKVQIRQK